MIASAALLKDLQKRVTLLEEDLRRRCDADSQVNAPLRAQYDAARAKNRTAETFNAWRDEQLNQVAVAWIMACVFVRFLEDNQLLDTPFLAGPDASRMSRARDEQELFFKQHPTASERDYLLHVFDAVGQLPGMRDFFDRRHNPLWLAGPTGDALAALLDFWRKTNPDTGTLAHDFTDSRVFSLSGPGGEGEGRLPAEASAQAGGEVGGPIHQPSTINHSDPTRFLGDLYQDLSEFARKRYALLQTPEFVEQFILDRTLTPAIDTFGYRVVRMIDMTCGSGHFLLGGFDRLFRLWQENEPGENPTVLAQRALDQVYGVDLNPNVVAIARFRLLLAALRACGVTRLKNAPNFRLNLAAGDSLLHGSRFREFEGQQSVQQTFGGDELFRDELQHFYDTEDRDALHRILGQQYHVVVGNPPYITVKDKALNQAYRDRFDSCHRKYSLAAPFMERFFDLAIRGQPVMKCCSPLTPAPRLPSGGQVSPWRGEGDTSGASGRSGAPRRIEARRAAVSLSGPGGEGEGRLPAEASAQAGGEVGEKTKSEIRNPKFQMPAPARQILNPKSEIINPGFVGMITANSFMKREFGKKLIEECIPKWDLTHVIDTSGAYIPGHGTPTVILFGKHQPPVAPTIRTVMGIKGEPATPDAPARGLVWTAILRQVDQPGSESEFVSVADTPRESFHKHPWSIGGGGAADLKERLDEAVKETVADVAETVGFASFPGLDDPFIANREAFIRSGVSPDLVKPFITGDHLRDWCASTEEAALLPYNGTFDLLDFERASNWGRHLWPFRASLSGVVSFGRRTREQSGQLWWGWYRWIPERYRNPHSLIFASVATHNQFVLRRSGYVLNRHAPIIQRTPEASDADYFGLLGLLNSSPACFWMKQVFHNKGSTVDQRGARQRTAPFEDFFEFDNTKLGAFPIPSEKPLALARELDRLAQELKTHAPTAVVAASANHTRAALDSARQRWSETLQRMIALQEELDWECYRIYGVASAEWGVASGEEALNPKVVPPLRLGERAFEIVMARKMAAGELQTTWFERHGSTPITELPAHWPQPYRELVQHRIALIGSDRNIALIEQAEYKRRWNTEPWDEQQERALRQWLLNRLEGYFFEGERMVGSAGASPAVGGAPAANTPVMPTDQSAGHRLQAPETGALPKLDALRTSWPAGQKPALVSTNQLAEVVQSDADFLRLAEIYTGGPGFSVAKLVRELVEDESVPFLPFQRYKESGLRKREDWERTWDLQRKEDAIDARVRPRSASVKAGGCSLRSPLTPAPRLPSGGQVSPCRGEGETTGASVHSVASGTVRARDASDSLSVPSGEGEGQGEVGEDRWLTPEEAKALKKREVGEIPVPPKYASADFKSSTFWRLRGKLDVPKERWISYPGAEREGDPSAVIAWAGWNHLQQAQALAEYYLTAKDTWGWSSERLTLLLAGLADLLPWLQQWHNDLNPEYGLGLGDYFAGFLDEETRKQGTTVEALNQERVGLKACK